MSVQVPHKGTRGGEMSRLPGPLMQWANGAVYWLFRGRNFFGMRLLKLTTVGARSGQTRHSTLGYFAESDNSWVIIGSAGGAASNPAWIYNIARNPDQVWVEIGKDKRQVRPETLEGEERAAMWQRILQVAPNYGAYATKTDREIPLLRLMPV